MKFKHIIGVLVVILVILIIVNGNRPQTAPIDNNNQPAATSVKDDAPEPLVVKGSIRPSFDSSTN